MKTKTQIKELLKQYKNNTISRIDFVNQVDKDKIDLFIALENFDRDSMRISLQMLVTHDIMQEGLEELINAYSELIINL